MTVTIRKRRAKWEKEDKWEVGREFVTGKGISLERKWEELL
jgi:hypothetical protein